MQFIGSTTLLLANATYTSGWTLSNTADRITGSVFADKAGTIFIEQSGDAVNADVSTSYNVSVSKGEGFSEEILLPWVRLRYTNGGTDQGAFRLSSRMSSGGVKP